MHISEPNQGPPACNKLVEDNLRISSYAQDRVLSPVAELACQKGLGVGKEKWKSAEGPPGGLNHQRLEE